MIDRDTDPLSFCINSGQTSPKYIETPTANNSQGFNKYLLEPKLPKHIYALSHVVEDQGRAANKTNTRQQTSKRVATFIETFRSRQEQEQEISQLLSSAQLFLF